MLPKIKLIGTRVAFTEIKEEFGSSLTIPSIHKRGTYELGQVFAAGPDVTYCEKGDVVVFQLPEVTKQSVLYRMGMKDESFAILHHDDVLAILRDPKSPRVTFDNFEIAGRWVLLKLIVNQPGSGLALPENYTPGLEDIRAEVVQIGRGVEPALRKQHVKDSESREKFGGWSPADEEFAMPYKVGDEVFVEKARANPIKLSKLDLEKGENVDFECVFLPFEYVYGVRE